MLSACVACVCDGGLYLMFGPRKCAALHAFWGQTSILFRWPLNGPITCDLNHQLTSTWRYLVGRIRTKQVKMRRIEPNVNVTPGRHSNEQLSPRCGAVHRNFIQSTRDLRRDIVRVVYYLERICSLKIHATLGFSTIEDYAFQVAGFSVAQTRRFLLLGHKLQNYPDIARALSTGDISFTKAMMICSMTEPHHQQEMLDLARTLTSRALKKHLAAVPGENVGAGPGRQPQRPPASSSETPPTAAPANPTGRTETPATALAEDDPRSGDRTLEPRRRCRQRQGRRMSTNNKRRPTVRNPNGMVTAAPMRRCLPVTLPSTSPFASRPSSISVGPISSIICDGITSICPRAT